VESKILAGLFGIPAGALPENWDSFRVYIKQMCGSDALGVSATARAMAQGLLAGAGSWIRPPHWYRALTAQWLPARFREEFALDFGAADQRAAERTRRWLPGIYRRLPSPVRYAGSWLEATARLDHRRAGPLIRASNRFWIGEPVLPFCG
jgi:uncharacterized protein (DUF2236 family)